MPVGIQDFEKLRSNGYVYVDKTAYVYKLAREGLPYFLGRPRRFGKSLLISTLKAYFLGRKELFAGLAIAELEQDWIKYPVFHIDLNVENYSRGLASLEAGLDTNLRMLEEQWGRDTAETTPAARLYGLIYRACKKAQRKVVVLIDEYDRPLLQTMDDEQAQTALRDALKGFYGVLKAADPWLRFYLLTGVTTFSQVSVFSDLNQLVDISMDREFAGICGISSQELTGTFDPELHELAEKNGLSYDGTLEEMQKRYNGYHFAKNTGGMYNPFSVLNTFFRGEFAYYWFKTGTPTFLLKKLKDARFNLLRFAGGISVSSASIDDYRGNGGSPVPILYQSGYLTIKDYNKQFDEYILGFPNEEVEYGFLNELAPFYSFGVPDWQGFFVGDFIKDLQRNDTEAFMVRLRAFFAAIPYELNDRSERFYQTVFYLLFTLMGQYTAVEVRSAAGRADAVIMGPDTVYVFEFKLAGVGGVEDALEQIDGKGYLIPYTVSGKRLVKAGAVFGKESRTLDEWKTVTLPASSSPP
jgi:hypothetical protein